MKKINTFTKLFLALGLLLIAYGYICRCFEIYFFWESKYIGWGVLLIGIIGLFTHSIKIKKEKNKSRIVENIGIGMIVVILATVPLSYIIFPQLAVYPLATKYLYTNKELQSEIGDLKAYTLLPKGGYEEGDNGGSIHGSAVFTFIVKGEKKYKEVQVFLNLGSYGWAVTDMENLGEDAKLDEQVAKKQHAILQDSIKHAMQKLLQSPIKKDSIIMTADSNNNPKSTGTQNKSTSTITKSTAI